MKKQGWLVLAGLALAGAGCNDSDNSNKTDDYVPYVHKTDYQIASCQYRFDEGGTAGTANFPEKRTFLFDKEIDYAKIRAVGNASAAETLHFVQNQGVSVYATHESDADACAVFATLQDAPYDFQKQWDKASGGTSEGSFIVGLFIPKNSQDVASSSASTALIGMRRDASRWTLVHEFSHFLFDSAVREKGGMHTDDLKKKLTDAIDAYDAADSAFRVSRSQVNFDAVTEKFQAAYKLGRELVLRFPAEEMAIETMLREGYNSGELAYLPFEKKSSYYYIYSSGENAKKLLDIFNKELDHLLSNGSTEGYWTDYEKLSSTRTDLNDFESKISDKASDARYQYENAAAFVSAGTESLTQCDHVQEFDDIVKHVGDVFGRH